MKHATAEKYYWMRYANDKAVVIRTDAGQVRIERNMLFGVRELRGKDLDEVVVAATGAVFRLAIAKSEKLMNAAKEYKGRTPAIAKPQSPTKAAPAERVVKNRRVVVAPQVQQSADSAMRALLKKQGVTVDMLTKASASKALRAVAVTVDDATALRLKKWLLGKVKPALRTFLETFNVVESKPVKIQAPTKQPKPATPQSTHHPKVKLSEVEMPEVDDFVDDEIPSEFRRFMNSESAAKRK